MWKWNGSSIGEVLVVCDAMRERRPVSKHSSGTAYEDIARAWLRLMPYHCVHKRTFRSNQIGAQISLDYLRDKFNYRYRVDGKQHYWFNWFAANFPLWEEITKGNSFVGKVTEVMLKFDVMRALSEVTPQEVFSAWDEERVTTDVRHDIIIDLDNLRRYMKQTTESVTLQSGALRAQMETNLVEAHLIEALVIGYNVSHECELTGKVLWAMPQTYRENEHYYRRYYTGSIALQRCHSKLREVCVGKGYQLDLNSSVYGFYRLLAQIAGINDNVLIELMENKSRFRNDIGSVLQNTYENRRVAKVKQAITAMGFGSRTGNFSAVDTIIRDNDDLAAFNKHPHIIRLKEFIKELKSWAKEYFAKDIAELRGVDTFMNGRQFNMNAFMAKLYQNYETNVMRAIMEFVESEGNEVVLWVHDGIYLRKKPDLYYDSILRDMNPFASAEVTQFDGVVYSSPVLAARDEDGHRRSIAQQERDARVYSDKINNSQELLKRQKYNRAFGVESDPIDRFTRPDREQYSDRMYSEMINSLFDPQEEHF
tara:strand:+ start:230 stop:1840 length:1611 start_codon:yes stop_codon:yes gene_type:complete